MEKDDRGKLGISPASLQVSSDSSEFGYQLLQNNFWTTAEHLKPPKGKSVSLEQDRTKDKDIKRQKDFRMGTFASSEEEVVKEEKFPCIRKPLHRRGQGELHRASSASTTVTAQRAKHRKFTEITAAAKHLFLSLISSSQDSTWTRGWGQEIRRVAMKLSLHQRVGAGGQSSSKGSRERSGAGGHEDILGRPLPHSAGN